MGKHVTIIGVNFYPEDSAIGLYSTQMCEYLLKKGFSITVITGFPYYPDWKIRDSYRKKSLWMHEFKGSIEIYRYKQYVPLNPSFIKRVVHMVDFTIGSYINIRKVKESNLVISIIPFTSTVLLGRTLARKSNAKHWVHIQDFEFDAAAESGILNTSIVFELLFKIEKMLLNSVDIVSTVSNAMLKKLTNKTNTDTYLFPNWIDQDLINPIYFCRHRYLNSLKTKVLYSGNIGLKQDWAFFLRIAAFFQNSKSIEFIIVGDGASKRDLVEKTDQFNNIYHHNPVDYSELNDLLCSADIHILFQKNDVIDSVMPSKLLGMMASCRPSIVTGNPESEVAEVFNSYQVGFFFDSNNLTGVTNKITELSKKSDLGSDIGQKARSYVVNNFSKDYVLSNFEKKLSSII